MPWTSFSQKTGRGRRSARSKHSAPTSQPILTFLSAKGGRPEEEEAVGVSAHTKEDPKKLACPSPDVPNPSDPTHTLPSSHAVPATPSVRQKRRRGRKASTRKQDSSSSQATPEAPVAVQHLSRASQPSQSVLVGAHAALKKTSFASSSSTSTKPNLKKTGNSSLGEISPSRKQQEEHLL